MLFNALQEDGNLGIKLWRANGQIVQSGIATLCMDTWTFIGVTYNHGVLQVVVKPNGMDNTSASFDFDDYSIVDSNNPLVFGGFVGGLDDVWLFNRDISMSEVDSIWFTHIQHLVVFMMWWCRRCLPLLA